MQQLETEYTCAVVPKKPKNGQLANEEGSIYGFQDDNPDRALFRK
jgi:hypothetical protein